MREVVSSIPDRGNNNYSTMSFSSDLVTGRPTVFSSEHAFPGDHCFTMTEAPSSDHYCIGIVVPSSDHCYTETVPPVPPSSDHYCTKEIAPPSDHLHTKRM